MYNARIVTEEWEQSSKICLSGIVITKAFLCITLSGENTLIFASDMVCMIAFTNYRHLFVSTSVKTREKTLTLFNTSIKSMHNIFGNNPDEPIMYFSRMKSRSFIVTDMYRKHVKLTHIRQYVSRRKVSNHRRLYFKMLILYCIPHPPLYMRTYLLLYYLIQCSSHIHSFSLNLVMLQCRFCFLLALLSVYVTQIYY